MIFATRKRAVAFVRQLDWQAWTTQRPTLVERAIVFTKRKPPLRPAVVDPMRDVVVLLGRLRRNVTFRFGLKPVPVTVSGLPRMTIGGETLSRAVVEALPPATARASPPAAARMSANVLCMRKL